MERIKAVFHWSGGKDSAHALLRAQQSGCYDILALLTTVHHPSQRSTLHEIPLSLLQAQAASIGIPLRIAALPSEGNTEEYAATMSRIAEEFKGMGVRHFIFGDIFLHDVRAYREQRLSPYGIEVVEPLWGRSSEEIMRDFLASGLQSVVITIRTECLDPKSLGRKIDRSFVESLPIGVDPNGEYGEYHTFCYDGPIFAQPIPFRLGTPSSQSYDVRLDDGTMLTHTYLTAELEAAQVPNAG